MRPPSEALALMAFVLLANSFLNWTSAPGATESNLTFSRQEISTALNQGATRLSQSLPAATSIFYEYRPPSSFIETALTECPVGSRQYCPINAPVCCAIKHSGGERVWECHKARSDCVDH